METECFQRLLHGEALQRGVVGNLDKLVKEKATLRGKVEVLKEEERRCVVGKGDEGILSSIQSRTGMS